MAKKKSRDHKKKSHSEQSSAQLNIILQKTSELYQKGEIKDALLLTEQSLTQFPNHPLLLGNAGIFSICTGNEKTAIKYFKKSLKVNPNNPDTHNNLGNVFKDTGQFNQAEISYKNALDLKPDYVNALYNLGSLFLLKN